MPRNKAVTRPGKISDVIDVQLGDEALCPRCGNDTSFTVYFKSEVISVPIDQIMAKDRNWAVGQPNLGRLRIKDVRCAECGKRGTKKDFSIQGAEEDHDEEGT